MWSRSTASRRSTCVDAVDSARLEEDERVALEDGVADARPRRGARRRRARAAIDVLHLHRFHHEQRLARRGPTSPSRDVDRDDRALQRRAHRDDAVAGSSSRRPSGPSPPSCRSQHGERVARRRARRRAPAGRAAVDRSGARAPAAAAATSSAACSSTKRVWTRARGERRVREQRLRGTSRLVATPSMRNSASARSRARERVAEVARPARARPPWRAASRSAGWCGSRRSPQCRRARRGPAAARTRSSVPPAGSAVRRRRRCVSVLTRACDREAARRGDVACARPSSASVRAGGERSWRAHEVDAGHLLGDGVLDLEARVGLDEADESSPRVGVDQELERAEARDSARPRASRTRRARAAARAAPAARPRRGRDLDELLVAALHAAVALAEVRDRAGAVADDLHLDVARARQQLLDVDARRRRTRPRASERQRAKASARARRAACTARMPRPPPPATALIIDARRAPSARGTPRASSSDVGPSVPGEHRHAAALGERARAAPCRRTARAPPGAARRTTRPALARSAAAKPAFSARKP